MHQGHPTGQVAAAQLGVRPHSVKWSQGRVYHRQIIPTAIKDERCMLPQTPGAGVRPPGLPRKNSGAFLSLSKGALAGGRRVKFIGPWYQPDQERTTAYRTNAGPDSQTDAFSATDVGDWQQSSGESQFIPLLYLSDDQHATILSGAESPT